jgi:YidC/Oxa1 family membrane protein insertase
MSNNKIKKILIAVFMTLLLTGCTTQLTDSNKKRVTNPETGQALTKNILCQPENEDVINIYKEHEEVSNVKIDELPKCENFSVTSGGYDGIWSTFIVKPLAWLIIQFGNIFKNYGVGLIITSLLIRLVSLPITKKTAQQSELMKEAKPALDRLEQKYAGKTDRDSMMKKSNEMTMIYKKYNINPISGCIYALIQIPLFIGFFEAINRVPAIFEGRLFGLQLGTTITTALSKGYFLYLILTIIVGLTTYYSFKLNSASNPDNQQAKMMSRVMVIMIIVMSFFMTSALNIYWVTTNLFTVVQNLIIKKKKVKVK